MPKGGERVTRVVYLPAGLRIADQKIVFIGARYSFALYVAALFTALAACCAALPFKARLCMKALVGKYMV